MMHWLAIYGLFLLKTITLVAAALILLAGIIALSSKEKLNKGNSTIELKAHQSVLQGRQAPFYLATFSIERMSPAPGKPTKYGDSAINQYEITDFAVSSLNDTPYQPSEQEQQRLRLLQNMAQGG